MCSLGEKSTKFFLNLEKYRAIQSHEKEIPDENELKERLLHFYQNIFSEKQRSQVEQVLS